MLGDMDMVEFGDDRSPPREDDKAQVSAFQALTRLLSVHDGWRNRFPHQRAFSYPTRPLPQSQSRIDRIYLCDSLLSTSEGWEITTSTLHTDHKLASVQLSNQNSPFLGKGRWSLNLAVLRNKQLATKLRSAVATLHAALGEGHLRSGDKNPQTFYAAFKAEVRDVLREGSKKILPNISLRLAHLQVELDLLLCDPNITSDDTKKLESALLQERILQLQIERKSSLQAATTAHCAVKNETVSKFWVNLNSTKKPRDIFYSMEKPTAARGEDRYERRSDKMAGVARDYHNNLQSTYETHDMPKDVATDHVLNQLPKSLNNRDRSNMKKQFTPLEIRLALYSTATGVAHRMRRQAKHTTMDGTGRPGLSDTLRDNLAFIHGTRLTYGLLKASSRRGGETISRFISRSGKYITGEHGYAIVLCYRERPPRPAPAPV